MCIGEIMFEKDMYQPIKDFLTDLGYDVKAEVKNVDIVAMKEDQVIIIEMKKSLSLKLLYQGCNRQKMYQDVYLAILDPGIKQIRTKSFKEKEHIIRRLNLGLIIVDMSKLEVKIIFDPSPYHLRTNYKKKKLLLEEFKSRVQSNNTGGVIREKIMTAYKERVIEIAKTLTTGPLSTKRIREQTGNNKVTKILYDNFYGWFERIDRGVYQLSEKGKVELLEFV